MRQVIGWAIVIFAAYYVIKDPGPAAMAVQHLGHGVGAVANSLANFASHL